MKYILSFAITLIVLACNDKAEPGNKSKLTSLKEWYIAPEIAKKMTDYLSHSTGTYKDNTDIVVANLPVLNALRKKYPNSNIVLVPARYKDETDEQRYRIRRNITDEDEYKVKDHVTILYMVPANGKDVGVDEFYDAASICPPPYPCRDKFQLDTLRF